MFLTLTYDDEHLPSDYGLHKKDLSAFFKRLRSSLEYYEDKKVKFYACGEYGPTTKRPHYHTIIFGLSPYDEKAKEYIISAWQHRCQDWQFDRNRGKKSAIQPVCPEAIEYVTGYIQKKLSGELGAKEYGNKERPFALMSKGLGKEFCLSNADRLRSNGFTYISGHKISLPRYFRDKLEIQVDYTNVPKKDLASYEADLKYLTQKFEEDMKLRGIEINHKDPDRETQLFERWYDSHRWQLADRVYKDFEQRQRMRFGL